MQKKLRPTIVLYLNLGFLAIVALTWVDDLLALSGRIFGSHLYLTRTQASMLEMLFIVVVWLLVNISIRHVLDRVQYLERFMKICAWCRRIDYKGRWMPLEEFLQQGFDTPTSHGICEECLALQKEAAARAKQSKKEPGPPPGQPSA